MGRGTRAGARSAAVPTGRVRDRGGARGEARQGSAGFGMASPTVESLLDLQRTAGNKAVSSMLAGAAASGVTAGVAGRAAPARPALTVQRRMAGVADALRETGGKTGLFGKLFSSKWEDIISALRDYEEKESRLDGRSFMRADEKKALLKALDKLEKLSSAWLDDPAHRAVYTLEPVDEEDQSREARAARSKRPPEAEVSRVKARARMVSDLLPRLRLERLDVESGRALKERGGRDDRSLAWSKEQAVGDKMKKLDLIAHHGPGGKEQKGYFAAEERQAPENKNEAHNAGVDLERPNWGARAVAMSRLGELLGAGSILAKTEFGTHRGEFRESEGQLGPTETKVGFLQSEASGTQMGKLNDKGLVALSERERKRPGPGRSRGGISLEDPVLQKALSTMQVIDAIAGQLDRHILNYFVEQDDNGHVTAVTGIDLDMAFAPEHENVEAQNWSSRGSPTPKHYKGVPALIDRDFGEQLLQVDDDEVRKLLAALLPAQDAAMAVGRFRQVKEKIQDLMDSDSLVTEWGEATAGQQLDERSSYLGVARMDQFNQAYDQAQDSLSLQTPGGNKYDKRFWSRQIYPTIVQPAVRTTKELRPQGVINMLFRFREELPNLDPVLAEVDRVQSLLLETNPDALGALNRAWDTAKDGWYSSCLTGWLEFLQDNPLAAVEDFPPAPPVPGVPMPALPPVRQKAGV